MDYLAQFVKMAQKTTPEELVESYPRPFLVQREKFQEHSQMGGRGTLMFDVSRLKEILAETEDKKQPRRFFYLDSDEMAVGRAEDADICLAHLSISKEHARMEADGTEPVAYELTDLGSTNGTFLNEEQLDEGETRSLADSDVVAFGSLSFSYYEASSFLDLVETMVEKLGGRQLAS